MSEAALPQRTALYPTNRYWIFGLIAVLGCAIDLATKSWAFARIGSPYAYDQSPIVLWENIFSLTTGLNEGALFGIGRGFTPLFAMLSVGAAVGILYWLFIVGVAKDRLLTVSLGLLMAGIFGNLYDRLGLHGLTRYDALGSSERVYAVRDWLYIEAINWPIFNIADVCLVCGAALLMWHAFRYGEPSKS